MRIADLGCGSKKMPGSVGIDIHPYPGVDIVLDLNKTPWPISNGEFDKVIASHVIEHVQDMVPFMREIHRILKPGGTVVVYTPHFSSVNSWTDPTHVRHLSARWYRSFQKGEYLAEQTGAFDLIQTRVTFGKSLRSRMARLIVQMRGLDKWEKNSAFRYPGMDVETELTRLP